MKRLWMAGLMVMGAAAAATAPASADWRLAIGASHDRGARGAGPRSATGSTGAGARARKRGTATGAAAGTRDFWREARTGTATAATRAGWVPVGLRGRLRQGYYESARPARAVAAAATPTTPRTAGTTDEDRPRRRQARAPDRHQRRPTVQGRGWRRMTSPSGPTASRQALCYDG